MLQRQPSAIRSRLRERGIESGRKVQPITDANRKPDEPPAEQAPAEQADSSRVGPWTLEEDEKLRRFANAPVPVLAELLRRLPDAVEVRLYKLGLYARGEAPLSLTRAPRPKSRRWPSMTIVVGSFAAGLLVGLVGGHFIGLGRSSPPPVLGPDADDRPPSQSVQGFTVPHDECLRVATWNIRGYPERRDEDTAWFHEQLRKLQADVLCVQEIANEQRLATLLESGAPYSQSVFADSGSGQDNAILAVAGVGLADLEVAGGFQCPAQAAFATYRGLDAVVVTVHLAWEPASARLKEMRLLEPLVREMLQIDPDVMVVGDFNLEPNEASALAERLGMSVLFAVNQTAVGTLHSGSSYDYFLLSPDLAEEEALGATVVVFEDTDLEIARRVSDHMPLLAYFSCGERFRDRPAE